MNGIEQNPKLGYYRVNDQTFYSKPMAYIEATKQNVDPSWHFNNVEFARQTWDLEPETDLRELYRLRAQQLRDRYDWIRIEASGGGDSTTAIFSFLLNGIHLDEIVFRYPKQAEKDAVGNARDTKPENTLGEWEFAAQPLLEWVKTHYPKTTITFHDYSEDIISGDYMRDESWIFTTRDWFQPGHGAKHTNFGTREHQQLADSGKSIGVIYGIDKPRVVLINNHWYTYFTDVFANHANPVVNDYSNITTELFYWSPDLPELVIKQSHMIKAWFDLMHNQNLKNLVTFPVVNPNMRTAYESIAKSIIYPDYDQHTWQTSKPTSSFYNEMDHWFHINLSNTQIHDVWKSGLQYIVNNISKDLLHYQDGIPTGLRWNKSVFYHLGASTALDKTTTFSNRQYTSAITEEITVLQDRKLKRITV